MKVTTETGSTYEFDMPGLKMRRVNENWVLRRDQEWVKMLAKPQVVIGQEMVILLEPLGGGDMTTRITTRVTEIDYDRD